jgi:hypothetical protein
MAEFITEANLNSLFTKTAPTKADTIQGGGDVDTVRT